MATSSPIAGLPRPELTDLPNAPSAFVNLTNALDNITIPRFTNAAARDAAITSPVDGQHAYLLDTHKLWFYDAALAGWRRHTAELIKVAVTVATPTVTFSSIPTTLSNITVWWSCRTTDPGFMAQSIHMRVNGDATSSRYRTMGTQSSINGGTPAVSSSVFTNTSAAVDGQKAFVGLTATSGAAAGIAGYGSVRFPAWNNSSANQGWQYAAEVLNDDTHMWDTRGSGIYVGTGPYTSLTFSTANGNFDVGTQFYLVGQP